MTPRRTGPLTACALSTILLAGCSGVGRPVVTGSGIRSPASTTSSTANGAVGSAATDTAPTSAPRSMEAPTAPTAGETTGSATSTGGNNVDAAPLAAQLRSAIASITSAHIVMRQTIDNLPPSDYVGDATFASGKASAIALTETLHGDPSEPADDAKTQMLLIGGKVYGKGSLMLAGPLAEPAGNQWVVYATSAIPPNDGQAVLLLQPFSQAVLPINTPPLVAVASAVTRRGKETIAGEATTHYSVTTDLFKAASGASGSQPSGSPAALELWVDDQGRPIQAYLKYGSSDFPHTTMATFSDFNESVTIKAPPASQVTAGA